MILCCGEALIDLITDPETDTQTPVVGGSVLNTAVALGRLGAPVGLLTGLSSDVYGQQISAHLAASHVETDLAIHSDRPTTLAIVTFKDNQPQYRFEDEGSALRMITPDDLPAIPESTQAMVFGGISLIAPPASDTFAGLCVARPANAVALLDTNIRPGFIDDPTAYRARLARMLASVEMVKVSDEDLDWLFPDASDPVAQLLDMGPAMVLLTKGSQGADAHCRSGLKAHAPSDPVSVVDTVGAGDTFNAGFLAALLEQDALSRDGLAQLSADPLTHALRRGAQAAAITVSRKGANPPWAHEMPG